MIKLDQLRYFVAAAETGSFAAAERSIFVSANSIVRAVDILEQTLGAQLFVRKASQGLTLTADGTRLLGLASRLLEDAADLERSFNADNLLSGEITVGCADSLAWSLAPLLIERIKKTLPELHIKLLVVPLAEDITNLLESQVDVLLTFHTIEKADIANVELLIEAKPFAMVKADHPLASLTQVSMKEMAQYPLIALDSGPAFEYYTEHYKRLGIEVDVTLRTSSSTVSWSLVSVTDMVALRHLRPQQLMSPLGKPIACVPLSDELPKARIVMLTLKRPSRYMSHKVELFRQFCLDFISSGGFDDYVFRD